MSTESDRLIRYGCSLADPQGLERWREDAERREREFEQERRREQREQQEINSVREVALLRAEVENLRNELAPVRGEIDQRHDVVQIVAVIVLVRPGDEQMLASDTRRALEPFEMQPGLAGPVRHRVVDDRLDRRQIAFSKRHEKRVTPDPALRRNEHAERRKPVLIEEMLERHRRRMDGEIGRASCRERVCLYV